MTWLLYKAKTHAYGLGCAWMSLVVFCYVDLYSVVLVWDSCMWFSLYTHTLSHLTWYRET